MPAAAVIPAPIAYINAVAVKKLVVGFRGGVARREWPWRLRPQRALPSTLRSPQPPTARKRGLAEVLFTEGGGTVAPNARSRAVRGRYCEQNSVFKASGLSAMNDQAWNNKASTSG